MSIKFKNLFFKRKRSLGIWGWWQGKNLGDIWIKQSMSHAFQGGSFLDTDTPVKDFNRYAFIICGGGGLFIRGTHESWNGKIPVSFGAIGLGAEFEHKNKKAYELSKTAEFFFVRDQYSVDCMHLSPNSRSYDITFFDPLPVLNELNKNNVLLIWRDPDELLKYMDFRKYIGATVERNKWIEVLENKFKTVLINDFNTDDNYIEALTNNIGLVVSARYHGIIAAIQRGIPCIGIDLCPKTRALLHEGGLDNFCLKINEISRLEEIITQCFDDTMAIKQRQLEFVETARTKIKKDIVLALSKIKNCT